MLVAYGRIIITPGTGKDGNALRHNNNSALGKFGIYNVSDVSFGYDANAYYIEFSFAADNKFRLFANMTGIAFRQWDGSRWEELWSK